MLTDVTYTRNFWRNHYLSTSDSKYSSQKLNGDFYVTQNVLFIKSELFDF